MHAGGGGGERIAADKLDDDISDALAWLSTAFDVRGNPVEFADLSVPGIGPLSKTPTLPTWHTSYLCGVERACVLLGVEYVGETLWYAVGAEYLVSVQSSSGEWYMASAVERGGVGGGLPFDSVLVDTAFSVLFLRRATECLVPPRAAEPQVATPR
jgi:hypothetical protein